MRTLDKYIVTLITKSIFFVLLILVLLVSTLDLIDEIKKYDFSLALAYVLLSVPQNTYEVLPFACLIGSFSSIAKLLVANEVTAIKAAGISTSKIFKILFISSLFFSSFSLFNGGFLAPNGLQFGNEIKIINQKSRVSLKDNSGTWVKNVNEFINIKNILPNKTLKEVYIYKFNSNQQLEEILTVNEARYANDSWILKNITSTNFMEKEILTNKIDSAVISKFIDLDLFDFIVIQPNEMSLFQLNQYIKYLNNNNLDPYEFRLSYWEKFSQSALCFIMIILSMTLLKVNPRSMNVNYIVLQGVILGVIIFLFSQSINKLSLIFQFNPFISAFSPIIIIVSGIYFYFKKKKLLIN